MNSRIYKRGDALVLDDYFAYLAENRSMIPDTFSGFVCDMRRYLAGPESLLNSKYVSMKRNEHTERLILKFRRPDDRLFTFSFKGVYMVKLSNPSGSLRCRELLIHEFMILRNGFFRYEFTSVTNDKIIIDFIDLKVTVK